jgi:hypothetical protein
VPPPELPCDFDPPPGWPPTLGRSAEPSDFARRVRMINNMRVHCNKCGQVIVEDRSRVLALCGPLRRRLRHAELCPDCARALTGRPAACRAGLPPEPATPRRRVTGGGTIVSRTS